MKTHNKFLINKFFWQIATLFALIILFINPVSFTLQKLGLAQNTIKIPKIIPTVEAEEIYSMFSCPCCGEPLDKDNPCCGSMIQMIDFIDQKISTNANKKDVILATAQEFGLERLIDKNDRLSLRQELLKNAPKDAPRISLLQIKKDLGKVDRKNGVVTTEFTIKNEGKTDLIIDKLDSSCGCTSGSVIYKGVEGPRFYMPGHGHDQPKNWSISIAPGKEAAVKVYYDPMVHPDLTGAVTRTLSIHSNDPIDFESKLTITLDQI